MRTFIHHDGALGDTLLSLPCFSHIKSQSGELQIAGRPDVVEFLKEAAVVHGAISSDHAFFASLYSGPDKKLRMFLSGFERAYVFTVRSDSCAVSALRDNIPLTRIISTILPGDLRVHTAQHRLSQIDPGSRLFGQSSLLSVSPEHLSDARSLLKKEGFQSGRSLIAVHPGSGGKSKCWPLERYFDLIEHLKPVCDPFTIIFSGPAEDRDMKKKIDGFAARSTDIFYARDLSLITAASLLSLSDVYIGNDSGFTHLAAATGCATVALFGPTDPDIWKPVGRQVEVISAMTRTLEEISTDKVFEKAVSLISRPKSE